MNARTTLLTLYPSLSHILIDSDVVELRADSKRVVIQTGVGVVQIVNGIPSYDNGGVTSRFTLRGIDDDSPLFINMVALEMSRLNMIFAIVSQGTSNILPFIVKAAS